MASHKPIPLKFAAGVVKTDSPVASNGRWSDTYNVRFWKDLPEKWGGWVALTATALIGIARGATTWNDLTARQLIGVGTHLKLYAVSNADFIPVDITPLLSTQTVANPITTISGSATIAVNVPAHGAAVGQYIDVSGATAVGGVTANGSFAITQVVDANNVKVVAGTVATSSATGGGSSVVISVELAPGLVSPASGYGWGAAGWNSDYWNTARAASNISFNPRLWSLSNFGKILIAAPIDGAVYAWDPTTVPTPRASVIATAPTHVSGVMVTSDLIAIAWGTNYGGTRNLMQFWNSAQGDYTNWDTTALYGSVGAPSRVNQVGDGTRIMGGIDFGVHIALLWTDVALYALQYTGSQFVFDTTKVGSNCGLIGPHTAVSVGTVAYWMGPNGFYQYDGSVQVIPASDEIWEWVVQNLRLYYGVKSIAWYNQAYDEVYFAFCSQAAEEPDTYVCYSRRMQKWWNGKIVRTTATKFEAQDSRPILIGTDGILYQHDNGIDANGQPMPWTMSIDGMDVADGDLEIDVRGLACDMARQVGTISMTISAYNRTAVGSTPTDSQTITFGPTSELVDVAVSGRELQFDFAGGTAVGDDFRMGVLRLLAKSIGGRP